MRLAYYAGASTAAAAACLLKAFHQRPNFYSATVYLSQSNACLLILTNLLLVGACTFIYALQRLLYGPLRPIEIEQLSEKAWYAVLDTLLAMPSFREDVGGWLLAMFTLLLAGKVWGWIGEGRVDILEQGQPPSNPRLFHVRLVTSLVLSVFFDIAMLDYCIETVLADPRPGMMVIFTFEFAVLGVFSIFTLSRYMLCLIQLRVEKAQMQKAIEDRKTDIRAERAAARQNQTADGTPTPASPPNEDPIEVDENEVDVPGWEEKRRYLFFLEVLTDFIKLLIYLVFFTVSITFNGLPMHIMRDVYMTFASFSKRVADYVAYRKATSDMNGRFADATTEEIRGDSCIVCREAMVAWEQPNENAAQGQGQARIEGQQNAAAGAGTTPTPTAPRRRDEGLRAKKLPCGHILHLRCLKAWLERQQVCPTCRRPVIVATPNPTAPGGQARGDGANQQGRPPAQQRQGRARILNLGPFRIGFLNGPGDQIGNIVRQMQNQNQNQNQQGGQQDPNQQGPNHLGLQVPYATNNSNGQAPRATVPTHIQLQQIEQRMMQEAQSLGLEQQQLAILRAMEGEMGRLRMIQQQLHTQARDPPPTQAGQGPPAPVNPWHQHATPVMHPVMGVAPAPAPTPEAFTGNAGEQMGRGHESLPEGLVLPEGWTVMPLHRAPHVVGVPDVAAQSTAMQEPFTSPQQGANETGGPTDERGSPLFVPTVPAQGVPPTGQRAANGEVSGTPAPQAENSAGQTASSTADQTDNSRSQSGSEQRTPWNSDGWSFVDPPNGSGQPVSGEDHTEPEPCSSTNHNTQTNGAPVEPSEEKGKKAAVEDAPDAGT